MISGRRNQRVGQTVQQVAAMRLIYLGFNMVIQIATPMKKILGKWVHCGQAEGDIRAMGPGGLSVLCECKSRKPDTVEPHLIFSIFEHHQVARLDQHHRLGGISLVAWHLGGMGKLYILPWDLMRTQGFGPGISIKESWAELNQYRRDQVERRHGT